MKYFIVQYVTTAYRPKSITVQSSTAEKAKALAVKALDIDLGQITDTFEEMSA
jgi:hypothetical protein